MNRCVVPRGRIPAKWLTAVIRGYTTPISVSNGPQENGDSHLRPNGEIVRADENGNGAQPSADSSQSKSLSCKRHDLPLSPLMDPTTLAAKSKHHARKPQPSKIPTAFQQALAKNPYALALATPLRMCQYTKLVLPNFFLQNFNLMEHPKTKDPWYVPRSLTSKHTSLGNKVTDEKISEKPDCTPTIGPKVYTAARKSVIRSLSPGKWRALAPPRLRSMKASMKTLEKAGWRDDMDGFVLELMRRRLVEGLVYLVGLKRGYVVGCVDWEDAIRKPQVGAILWTRRADNEGIVEVETEQVNYGPPEFATLDLGTHKKRKIPVHNLRMLLGTEKLQELRGQCPSGVFDKELVGLRHRNNTVELQLRLWKLQGYLAEYNEHVEAREVMACGGRKV